MTHPERFPTRRTPARFLVLLAGATLPWTAACGGGAMRATAEGPETDGPPVAVDAWSAELENRSGTAQPLVPVGYGTLSQDEITVPLRTQGLQIKWVPLSEWVLRLTAPDTYRRLNGYKVSRAEEILERTQRAGERGWPLVTLVTFFSQEVEETFEPYDLQVENQGRLYRAFEIIPVTPGFGRDRIDQQETQIALYLFPREIDLDLPTTVRYVGAANDRWNTIRSDLDSERSRANSRAGAGGP